MSNVHDIRNAEMRPIRVGIVIPSGDMVHANFSMALAIMMYATRGVQCILVSVKGSNIANNRNRGVDQARQHECDYVLMIDSDMTFPGNALLRLLKHAVAGCDVVGATYVSRSQPHHNLAKPLADGAVTLDDGTHEVEALPTGFLLINMKVFDKLTHENGDNLPFYFGKRDVPLRDADGVLIGQNQRIITGEDYNFCEDARKAGFKVWLDVGLSYEVAHWGTVAWRPAADASGAVMLEEAA